MKNILNNLIFVDHKGNPINGHIVYDFYEQLDKSNSLKIFRGENRNALIELYNIGGNPDLLAEFIFMVGEKSVAFYERNNSRPAGYTDNDSRLVDILWSRLHDKICYFETNAKNSTRNRLLQFFEKSLSLFDYFATDGNKDDFVNKLNRLEIKDRIMVIDYYYSLLHTIGKYGYGYSYMLSTSTDYKVAKDFSNGEEGLVIYGWIPQNNRGLVITYQDVKKLELSVQDLGFPIYSQAMYPEQNEICLKFGLLANFIIGFEMNGKFYVNPLLEQYGNTISNGFTKDEERFKEMVKTTKYGRYFTYEWYPYLEDSTNTYVSNK